MRPPVITCGRVRPEHPLGWETLVSTIGRGAARLATGTVSNEERRAAGLCTEPRSVAEVAALLLVPIAVSRIVLGDMVEQHVITATDLRPAQTRTLFRRRLNKLRRI